MKKRELAFFKLNKKVVSNFQIKGGEPPYTDVNCDYPEDTLRGCWVPIPLTYFGGGC